MRAEHRALGFEAHITFPVELAAAVRCLRWDYRLRDPRREPVWKYSQIDGDPVLGDLRFCYLSAWHRSYAELQDRLGLLVDRALEWGLRPLRTKIEAVVYDVRW